MLKSLYIDNYKCLTNFELNLDSLTLFVGPNGSGKSSVLEVLRLIQAFVAQGDRVGQLFPVSSLTRWQTRPNQTIELKVEGNGGTYSYRFVVEHLLDRAIARVAYEHLSFDGKPLLNFEVKQGEGQARLYNDRHGAGPVLLFDWSRSALSAVFPRNDNTRLTWFKDYLRKAVIVQIDPFAMSTESSEEATILDSQAGNFVSWYRQVSRDQGLTIDIVNQLRSVIDGYQSFKFAEAGEQHRVLWVGFGDDGDRRKETMYRLDELSHGQRALIVLYTLIEFFRGQDAGPFLLCLDEPENFVALPELQPWLVTLHDYCLDGSLQAILVSHHPEFIDYLAARNGVWFDRQPNSPVRVHRLDAEDGGLPISELVARGWIDG